MNQCIAMITVIFQIIGKLLHILNYYIIIEISTRNTLRSLDYLIFEMYAIYAELMAKVKN